MFRSRFNLYFPVLLFTTFLALWTLFTNFFALTGLSWDILSSYGLLPFFFTILWLFLNREDLLKRSEDNSPLPLSAVICASISTFIFLGVLFFVHRPDADDNYYLNLIITLLDNPHYRIFYEDSTLREEGLNLLLPAYKYTSYEVFIAWVSQLIKADYRIVYYFILPSITALLSLAVSLLFIGQFIKSHHKYFALLVSVLILVVWGETHFAYGNRTIVRLFQGKGALISFAVPAIFVFTEKYVSKPTWKSWLNLAFIQIASLGLSTSAIVIAPVVAGIGLLMNTFNQKLPIYSALRGLSSSAYIFIIAAVLAISNGGGYGDIGTPESIYASLGEWPRVTLTLLLLVGALAYKGNQHFFQRMLYLYSLILCGIFILNPIASFVTSTLVARNMSWRLAWAAPIPLLLAIAVTVLIFTGKTYVKLPSLLLCILFIFTGRWSIDKENNLFYGWFKFKVPESYYAAEKVTLKLSKSNTLLAPESISTWIPTFRNHPRQLISRKGEIYHLLASQQEASNRTLLQQVLDGSLVDVDFDLFFEEIKQRGTDSLVLVRSNSNYETLRFLASKHGFINNTLIDDRYELLIRK